MYRKVLIGLGLVGVTGVGVIVLTKLHKKNKKKNIEPDIESSDQTMSAAQMDIDKMEDEEFTKDVFEKYVNETMDNRQDVFTERMNEMSSILLDRLDELASQINNIEYNVLSMGIK